MALGRFRHRLLNLEKRLPVSSAEDRKVRQALAAWEKRRRLVTQRLLQLLEEALAIMAPGDRRPVQEGLRRWIETWKGPYAPWFLSLAQGRSRLPELGRDIVKRLLLTWLDPDCDRQLAQVCRGCGLAYPHRRTPPFGEWQRAPGKAPSAGWPYEVPVFFASCPACGTSVLASDWAHLVTPEQCGWTRLDGYVGRKPCLNDQGQ